MKQDSPAAASQASRSTRALELRAEDDGGRGLKQAQGGEGPEGAPLAPPIIQVENLEKTYTTARGSLTLFRGLDFEVQKGEMVAIVGQSGAGKSTLCTFWGLLILLPREGYTARQPTWRGSRSGRRLPFATAKSATCGSFITCCRSLPRRKMWPCR